MNVALSRSFLSASKRGFASSGCRNVTLASRTLKPPSRPAAARLPKTASAFASTSADLAEEALAEISSSEAPASQSEVEAATTNGNGNGTVPPLAADVFGAPTEPGATDWSKSYSGLSQQAFPKEVVDVLLAPIDPLDVEIKPDGLLYLPEIKYRRVLNKAFGPGGWGLAPRSETNVGPKVVSREYALVCLGRLVAVSRGEQAYYDRDGIATATEACKSNALMRCCKDLGVASELWDPRFIREFKAQNCVEVFAEHLPTKKKKKLWRRKDQPKFDYPFKE
ncbi:unnamed protein product [Somion occarium]|uniref:Mitochondrial genome maintenance protein MGM101 n=1 Tax=Somion occarium TaxID=3059160 RepID=A0ABP1CX94_9APHY